MTLEAASASRQISRGRIMTLVGVVSLIVLYVMALQLTPS